MKKFMSNLKHHLIGFLELKHSLNIEYVTGEYYLKNYDKFNYSHKNLDYLDKETAELWIKNKKEASKASYCGYMSFIREFGKYLNSIDNKSYILSDKYTSPKYKPEVYLFTNTELHDFFLTIEKYKESRNNIKDKIVMPALFRFLYYFGVRCKEARVLECRNVHLNEGYIDIIGSKGHKDRRLYLNNETIIYFTKYNNNINSLCPNRTFFFIKSEDKPILSSHISKYFNTIWDLAGLRKETKVKPRAYDLRHHFACQNILKWSLNNEDVHSKLPYLMVYMGHSNLESTYYYIHLIPDFFPIYNEISKSSNDLIPEVIDYEI